jgi:hypothetical protein
MYCIKDDLYRTLIGIKRDDDERGLDLSPEYLDCVDAIKEHDRTGHHGQPCPDAGY